MDAEDAEESDESPSLLELGYDRPLVFEEHVTAVCTQCGGTEEGPVTVTLEDQWNRIHNPDKTISEDHHVTFHCETCDIEETAGSGLFPERLTDSFVTREPGETTDIRIDGREVVYRTFDEQVVESAYGEYDRDQITTSRVHHLHVHAVNPPTFTTRSAHHVEIGDYLEMDMMLVDVDYHNGKNRTLKFVRGLDKGVLEKMEEIRRD